MHEKHNMLKVYKIHKETILDNEKIQIVYTDDRINNKNNVHNNRIVQINNYQPK